MNCEIHKFIQLAARFEEPVSLSGHCHFKNDRKHWSAKKEEEVEQLMKITGLVSLGFSKSSLPPRKKIVTLLKRVWFDHFRIKEQN